MRMNRSVNWLLAVLASLALLAAACGDDAEATDAGDETAESDETMTDGDDDAASDDAVSDDAMDDEHDETDDSMEEDTNADGMAGGGFPVTIESASGEITLGAAPQRIVSLSPTSTEILFAIGAGDQVIAVDAFSNYPPEAPVTDLSGWDPNVEAVLEFEPDLVVIANDANDLVASLAAVDVPVYTHAAPADIESGYAGLADLGVITGHVDETAEVVATMRADMDAALAAAPDADVRIYHELDETFFSASSNGFVGSIYAALGASNIADEADADGTGFPQLTEEYIVEADPEVIVITDQVAYTADDLAARPGWSEITAVKNGNVVVVNADTASRWGPRLPEFVAAAAEALSQSAAVSAEG